MAHKITVDQNLCIGCGSSEAVCPKSFEMKDAKAHPKKASFDKITCEKEAEAICPTQAIKIS
ncbi:MAG: ferredoxin [archaeon]